MAGIEEGGRVLMDEINALFAPPGRGDAKSRASAKQAELHPYFKRPGKGHNHDCCDACGEGGDLLCCDFCPASFHFSCHCPPLEEEEIPMGDWSCLSCYYKEKTRTLTSEKVKSSVFPTHTETKEIATEILEDESSTNTSASAVPIQIPIRGGSSNRGRGSGRGGHRKQQTQEKDPENERKIKIYRMKYDNYLNLKPKTSSPFDTLIKATQIMNAEEFKLPPELNPHEQLPFSWKWKEERQDENDTFPRSCTICGKTTRGVPSVACDFCPSVYHLDCLDPPLCEVPTERWMCPNHVEQFIDSKLVNSTRLTERLALWQKYARDPINPDTVRMEFLRKARSGKLFNRSKTLKAQRPENLRIKVPDYIKRAYKNRPTGFPIQQSDILLRPNKGHQELNEDQDEWLKSLVALQSSLAKMETKVEEPPKKPKIIKKMHKRHKFKVEEDESTDSECELDFEIRDEVPVRMQYELTKYISKNKIIGKLKPQVKDFLAAQRLDSLFKKDITNEDLNIRSRAAFIPLDSKSRVSCPVSFRTFKIGIGSSVDLDLSKYGKCHSISAFHASLFFDQYSRVYELMNYSEHGTIVDNLIYSGDATIHPLPSKVQSMMKFKKMAKNARKIEEFSCFCTSTPAELNFEKGCEVSAVLHHGSYIRFGCLQFVFSITNYENDHDRESENQANFSLRSDHDVKTEESFVKDEEFDMEDD